MTNVLGFPILTYMVFIPLAGAVAMMLFFPRDKTGAIRNFSFVVSLLVLAFSLWLLPGFEAENVQMQYVEEYTWIPSLGVKYSIGVDGISILLIILTTLLSSISILCSYKAVKERQKEFYISLLILETGMLGVFVSLDLFLFYVFWELMLVPMYFLIGIWGGPRKLYAAIKFFLYTLVGSVLLLLGFLALYFLNANPAYGSGELTFNLLELYKMAPRLPAAHQFWIFLALFVGFAIKVPMFPFHTWLPDAHVEAPTAGSVILAGVLLKMGTYGFVRFSLPLLPKASETMVPFMALLAIIGIIYGALVAMAQSDVKKLVAYSSVSHLGFVMLGIFALNSQGLVGALLQNINHGLSTGALFLIVGIIYERRHTREISDFGGLAKVIPVFTVFFAITMFSSIGLPGLNGFVGEFLILVGAFQVSKVYAAFAVLGIVLGAAYMLWLFQRMMFGGVDKSENEGLADLNKREVIYLMPLILLMFWIGIYPKPYLRILEPAVNNLVRQINLAKAGKPIDGKAFARPAVLPKVPPRSAEEVRALVSQFKRGVSGK